MALMAYLQHLFSGAATRRNTSNYLSSNCKTICSGVVDINKLTQRIDGIRIECGLISKLLCRVFYRRPHFLIPNINRAIADPIQFLGTMDGAVF
jgi:hypothetical protein